MRTFEYTFSAYSLEELSDKAKERAYEIWCDRYGYYIASDSISMNIEVLESFCDSVGLRLRDWEIGGCCNHVTLELEEGFEGSISNSYFEWLDSGLSEIWNEQSAKLDNDDLHSYGLLARQIAEIAAKWINEDSDYAMDYEAFENDCYHAEFLFDKHGNFIDMPEGAREVA